MRSVALQDRLSGLPRPWILALGLLIGGLVAFVDHVTGIELLIAFFHTVPIAFTAWFAGAAWSLPVTALGISASLFDDLRAGHVYSSAAVPYENAVVRLAFFLVVTFLVERLRKARQAEEELSRVKSTMMSVVSHEFANSLHTLTLATALLKNSEKDGSVPFSRARGYGILDRTTRHLKLAVANFLSMNRLESGRFEVRPRPLDLRGLAQETMTMIQPLAEEKSIAVSLHGPPGAVTVRADPDALALVLSNLAGNAVKYTPAGGHVSLRLSVDGGKAVVAVEDSGIGVAPEEIKRILAGRYRTGEGQAMAKGFGIGLLVCREMLESQGSKLELESEPGKGSRFHFSLPLWEGPIAP